MKNISSTSKTSTLFHRLQASSADTCLLNLLILETFQDTSHLWWLLCVPVCVTSDFPDSSMAVAEIAKWLCYSQWLSVHCPSIPCYVVLDCNCYTGCVTVIVIQWLCHSGCITMVVLQSVHSSQFLHTMPCGIRLWLLHWSCHIGCVTIIVTLVVLQSVDQLLPPPYHAVWY